MKKLSTFLLVFLLVFQSLGIAIFAEEASNPGWNLTILHTNDTHAHLENISKRFTIVDQIRSEVENSILVDAGDVFAGTLYFTAFMGLADAKMMNMLGYDAMTLGNHEFDKGPAVLADFIKELEFPVVSSNIDFKSEASLSNLVQDSIGEEDLQGKIFPAIILDVNGEKVGVFGLTTEETKFIANPGENVKFLNHQEAAKNTVKMLEAEGVNKIIALSHLGYHVELKLAEAVQGIDVIVGGHSHTKLDEPVVIHHGNEPTLIVQANEWGKFLGRVDVTFNEEGVITEWNGYLIDINEKDEAGVFKIADNQEAVEVIKEFDKPINEMMSTVVGRTSIDLVGERELVRSQETNLGNLITDSILDKTSELVGATIAFHNGGNIRASIKAGDITLGDVRTVQPFENTIVTLDLTGKQIVSALELGVTQLGHGRFPHVAGMRYSFDVNKPEGERIISVEVKTENGYEPIDLAATYVVGTNAFLADGGDGYTMFKEAKDAGKMKDLYFVDYEVFVEYLKKVGEVSPTLEGRITNLATLEVAPAEEETVEQPVVEAPAVTPTPEPAPAPAPMPEPIPAPQPAPAPKAESKQEIVYYVKSGDVLWKIGREYGIDWKELAQYNNLKNPHLILVGQKILIPVK